MKNKSPLEEKKSREWDGVRTSALDDFYEENAGYYEEYVE